MLSKESSEPQETARFRSCRTQLNRASQDPERARANKCSIQIRGYRLSGIVIIFLNQRSACPKIVKARGITPVSARTNRLGVDLGSNSKRLKNPTCTFSTCSEYLNAHEEAQYKRTDETHASKSRIVASQETTLVQAIKEMTAPAAALALLVALEQAPQMTPELLKGTPKYTYDKTCSTSAPLKVILILNFFKPPALRKQTNLVLDTLTVSWFARQY
ncbi:Hypothetical protein NTJ_00175 [Nesidiocoris tenuis]|uniref:Uncharacterized protein n=1 Tax=Nesidiocoris tenuis TaxID=355587 RepID=A0ABN7A5A6_9HEMI|nr:Hypothetical protein NTJ_00175 [Nesidiocoris tenuis]